LLLCLSENRARNLHDTIHGFPHAIDVNVMNIDRNADGAQHRDRQPTAKVLTELFQTVKQSSHVSQCRVLQIEAQTAKAVQHSLCILLWEPMRERRINRVNGHTDRYSFAVANTEAGHGLQPVCRPVTKIQGTSLLHLEWVATTRNVLQMKFR